jgi:hypothetical protein
MTCVDIAMFTSLTHDVSAQYVASVMSALTMLAASSLWAAWRRRPLRRSQQEPEAPSSTSGSDQIHQTETSSDGRHEESS